MSSTKMPDYSHAIRCLEFELGRRLDEIDAMGRELNGLRALAAESLTTDRRHDDPPVKSAPSPAPAANPVACSPTATAGAGDTNDDTPPHGIIRPELELDSYGRRIEPKAGA